MKLAPSDFRFLSAWVQGVEVREAWSRYCAHRGSADLRRIRTAVRTMLDQLAAVARRHGDGATAALLRRDPGRIHPRSGPPAQAGPTLDTFAATLPDADFYSEAELIQLWEQRFGRGRDNLAAVAARRRARLVARQVDALRRLEQLAATAPVPEDELRAWLDAALAERLERVGLLRLQELITFINRHGYRWYRRVPRIGEEGAQRLSRWLGEHEASLGVLRLHAVVPIARLQRHQLTPPPSFGVVPIERLRLPEALSGREGSNRAPATRCKIAARNDHEAVQAWIDLRRPVADTGNAHTWRAYRKEAERFLLWALFERRKPLSSLDGADCMEYRRFLAQPGRMWIGPKSAQRWSEQWRPFEGPLAARSRRAAEVIVMSMCAWLVRVRYLDSNPWDVVPRSSRALPLGELRSLSDRQWERVEDWLATQPPTPATQRLQLMFHLALATGMREAEMAAARAEWLRLDLDEEGLPAWNLRVTGKGGRQRDVPLTRRLVQHLIDHFRRQGLLAGPQPQPNVLFDLDPATPLLSALADPMRPMAPARVYELMKAALRRCADDTQPDDAMAADRIRRASPHWMRHTHGRKFVEAGGDRGILRQNLGHASDATTAIYDRSEARRRRREVEKVFG